MALLDQVIANFRDIGVFQYVLPFLIVFAAVYGILGRLELFDENEQVNGIIAVVAGLFVANFAATTTFSLGLYLSNFFGAFAVVLVFLLGVLLAVGAAGEDEETMESIQKWFMYLAALAVVAVFVSRGGLTFLGVKAPSVKPFLSGTMFWTVLVVLGAIGLIWWVTGGGEEAGGGEEGE
ncbi:MAG: hypothetical protein ABEK12_01790 [Candidatus Nanohaloarchaea archaeon]